MKSSARTAPARRSSPAPTTERGSNEIQLAREGRSSIAIRGFVNRRKKHRGAHISLWHAGRGTSPSSPSFSRSGRSGRRRRGTEPDPPPADHHPSIGRSVLQPAAKHNSATATAPAHKSLSPQRRRRERRRDANKRGKQKSITSTSPRRRARLDRRAPHLQDLADLHRRDEEPKHIHRDGGISRSPPPRTPNSLAKLTSYTKIQSTDQPPSPLRRHRGRRERRAANLPTERWFALLSPSLEL